MREAPLILLLRASEGPADPYEAALRDASFRVRSVPILAVEPIDPPALATRIQRPERYQGAIFTSHRAAVMAGAALAQGGEAARRWREKPAFAVGPRTAEALRSAGWKPEAVPAGDAASLAEAVIRRPASLPWLFVCGERRRPTLPDALAAAGVAFEALVVYRTRGVVPDWSQESRPDAVAFFSPSGAEAAFLSLPPGWAEKALRVAIGPTTAEALAGRGMEVHAVAERPHARALRDAVQLAFTRI